MATHYRSTSTVLLPLYRLAISVLKLPPRTGAKTASPRAVVVAKHRFVVRVIDSMRTHRRVIEQFVRISNMYRDNISTVQHNEANEAQSSAKNTIWIVLRYADLLSNYPCSFFNAETPSLLEVRRAEKRLPILQLP